MPDVLSYAFLIALRLEVFWTELDQSAFDQRQRSLGNATAGNVALGQAAIRRQSAGGYKDGRTVDGADRTE